MEQGNSRQQRVQKCTLRYVSHRQARNSLDAHVTQVRHAHDHEVSYTRDDLCQRA